MITIIFLFGGLTLLLIGVLLKERSVSHIILLSGWVIFGLYWLTQIPHFLDIGDLFNAMFCLLGTILFFYFAYHELLNIRWKEYVSSLSYIAGITAVGGLFYYSIEKIEPLAKGLIYIVASQSVWFLNLFGLDAELGSFVYNLETHEFHLTILGIDPPISIILACTGIQSIAIFVGILIVTRSDRGLWVPWLKRFLKEKPPKDVKRSKIRSWLWDNKKGRMRKVRDMSDNSRFFRAFMYTIPIIYVLNIFRNVLIIWGSANEVLGPDTFYIAHNQLSKILSLAVLIIMVFITFELLPECQEQVVGLFDLPQRVKPGMVKDGFIEVKFDKSKDKIKKKKGVKKKGKKARKK